MKPKQQPRIIAYNLDLALGRLRESRGVFDLQRVRVATEPGDLKPTPFFCSSTILSPSNITILDQGPVFSLHSRWPFMSDDTAGNLVRCQNLPDLRPFDDTTIDLLGLRFFVGITGILIAGGPDTRVVHSGEAVPTGLGQCGCGCGLCRASLHRGVELNSRLVERSFPLFFFERPLRE